MSLHFYLQAHEPELAAEPDAAAEAIIEQGREVGMLARQLFPGGVEVHSPDLDQAIRATRELIANPKVSGIFEGAFEHGGVLVQLIVNGKSNRQITPQLALSANTVVTHRANIMQTLRINKTAELVAYAIRNGLASLP
jgi:DNA-binding NarL/FixJ family response regulator